MQQTLLLNATYEPMQVVSWKRAVKMLFQDKVEVVEVYPHRIRSVSIVIEMPAVIRLVHYVKVSRHHGRIKFSRANIFARDRHQCQYCGRRFLARELTCDHVVPVSKGGVKDWDNIVTCCVTCNRRKGNRTPAEAGLRLLKRPKTPAGFPTKVHFVLAQERAPEVWRAYIFWR